MTTKTDLSHRTTPNESAIRDRVSWCTRTGGTVKFFRKNAGLRGAKLLVLRAFTIGIMYHYLAANKSASFAKHDAIVFVEILAEASFLYRL
jgi:hypothetical protein